MKRKMTTTMEMIILMLSILMTTTFVHAEEQFSSEEEMNQEEVYNYETEDLLSEELSEFSDGVDHGIEKENVAEIDNKNVFVDLSDESNHSIHYEGVCGEKLTWIFDEEDEEGVLTISGTGEMYNYNRYFNRNAPWRFLVSHIDHVIIEYGVTCIGNDAFLECTTLKDVSISDSVTSIGYRSFGYCFSLYDITIPNSVTSIDYDAFSYTDLTIHGFKGSYAEEYAKRCGKKFSPIENTIVPSGYYYGTLQKADALTATVTMDNKVFSAAIDFDFQNATRILVDDASKKVIYYINETGEINSVTAESQLRINPCISIVSDVENIIYENGKLNCNEIGLTITFSFDIQDFHNKEIQGYIFEFNNPMVQVFDHTYFQNVLGIKIKEWNLEKKISLGCGEKKEYHTILYIDNNYVPETVNERIRINGDAETISDNGAFNYLEIPVTNRDKQREEAILAKSQSEMNKAAKRLKSSLDSSCVSVALDDGALKKFFDNKQIANIKKCITFHVSEAYLAVCSEKSYGKKVVDKLMDKLEVSRSITPFTNSFVTNFTIEEDSKYGVLNIKVSAKVDYYAWMDSTKPYAVKADIKYIIDKNVNVPADLHSSLKGMGMATFYQMSEFINGLDSAIKEALDLAWGENINKIVNYVTDDLIEDVTGKSFSENIYELITEPTRDYITKISVHCPVDVYVYDCNKKLCGRIEKNVVDSNYNSVFMMVDGDKKYIYLTGCDYHVKCVGNDIGSMDYAVEIYDGENLVRSIQYNNIPLINGKLYEADVFEGVYKDNSLYDLISDSKEIITASSDSYMHNKDIINVSGVELNKSSINLNKGKTEKLIATILPSNSTEKAVFWESDNPKIVSVDVDGKICALGAGKAIITAFTMDGRKTASCTVNVVDSSGLDVPILKNISVTNNSISINWKSVKKASGYIIYRKIDKGSWKKIKTLGNVTTYRDKAVKAGYSYTYTVKAYKKTKGKNLYSGYDKQGISGKLNTSIVLSSTKPNIVSINWKKTAGATGYYIYRSNSATGKYAKIKTITNADRINYTDKKVKEGQTYYYKVVPYRKIGSKYATGSSSKVEHIQVFSERNKDIFIYSENDLKKIKTAPNANYILMNDIIINNLSNDDWKFTFSGKLDGNGHTITLSNNASSGLFTCVSGTVMNLNVEGKMNIQRNDTKYTTIGTLADFLNKGKIIRCNSHVDIEYEIKEGSSSESEILGHSIGGIVGVIENEAEVVDCRNDGNIHVAVYATNCSVDVGGIVGGIHGDINNVQISNCTNEGKNILEDSGKEISGMMGGIVGFISRNVKDSDEIQISNCLNKGILNSNLDDTSYMGGIVGYLYNGTITECINKGNLSGKGKSSWVGGILGFTPSLYEVHIIRSKNEGDILSQATGPNDIASAVGIVGVVDVEKLHCNSCSNTGNVNALSSANFSWTGDIYPNH